MLDTVRVPMAAAAVLGAAVLPPAAAPNPLLSLPAPATAAVNLAAFANPIEQLLGTGELLQTYLFANYYNGSGSPTPGAGEANWPFAGFDQTGGGVLNYLLTQQVPLGKYNTVGALPNSVRNAGPVLQQLQVNLWEYVNVGLTGLTGALKDLAVGVWDFPVAVVNSAQLALQGQFGEAFTVLAQAFYQPLVNAGLDLLEAGGYILNSVVVKVAALVTAIPPIAATFVRYVAGGLGVFGQKAAALAGDWVGKLAQFDIQGAWNVAVNGLLGPEGLPGTVLNLNLGPGVQTGPIVDPQTDIATNFVPSLRTALQAAQWNIATALAADSGAIPVPGAAVTATRTSAAAVRAAADPAQTAAGDPVTPKGAGTGEQETADNAVAARSAAAARKGDPAERRAQHRARAGVTPAGD